MYAYVAHAYVAHVYDYLMKKGPKETGQPWETGTTTISAAGKKYVSHTYVTRDNSLNHST